MGKNGQPEMGRILPLGGNDLNSEWLLRGRHSSPSQHARIEKDRHGSHRAPGAEGTCFLNRMQLASVCGPLSAFIAC